MKRKRFLAVACAAAMIASMTTGLAVNVSAADEKSDFAGEELSILVSAGWMDNRYDETIKRFEDTYDVTVDLQTIPADQYSDLLQSKLATDSCADIFWIQSSPFAIESTIVDPEKYCIDFTGASWENIMPETRKESCVYNDKLYGLQIWNASPEYVMVYNKTLFEENGWETPVTWDDFFELGDKAKEKGIALFTYQGIYPGYLESMLWPALASATGIDNMKAIASYTPGSLSSDEALKVFQNMAKIGTDGYLMDGTVALNHTQSQTDMMMNKALFIPNGNWMEGEMADAPRADGFEFGLTCAPVLDDGETRYVMSSVEQFEIPANAKNPELAKEFLRFLYTEDSVKLFAEKANGIYALKKANEMVKGIVSDGVYNMNDIYQEGTFMVFGWDAMPDTSKVVIADSVFNVASDVMNGDMTAEQWRDGIEAAFEEIAASK